jgi:hypothetical protein
MLTGQSGARHWRRSLATLPEGADGLDQLCELADRAVIKGSTDEANEAYIHAPQQSGYNGGSDRPKMIGGI